VDGVGAQRRGVDAAAGDQLREPIVLGDLVDDAHRFVRHAAAFRERLEGEARPDHYAVVERITRGDAERER
jgi:hypothetical protein